MEYKKQKLYEERALILKALGHPARLCIVDALSGGERCVGDLTELVGSDMSTVSRHLSTLTQVGIIAGEKRKNQIYYRLCTPCIMNFFLCAEGVLQEKCQTLATDSQI